jgi:hypothetical protein
MLDVANDGRELEFASGTVSATGGEQNTTFGLQSSAIDPLFVTLNRPVDP